MILNKGKRIRRCTSIYYALVVFLRLSKDDQSDNDRLKEALLTNFDLTERTFRKRFRGRRPEKSENFEQFEG